MFLKSIQRGSITFGATTDVNTIDITAVDPTKCFLALKVQCLDTDSLDMVAYGTYGFVPEFVDSDTIRISRWYVPGYSRQMTVAWFVYELENGVGTVERGYTQFSASPTDIILTTDDADHSIPVVYLYSEYNAWSGDFDDQTIMNSIYNNGTNVVIRNRGNVTMSSPPHRLYWQAVTIPNGDIVKLTINNIPNTQNVNDYDLPSSVDMSRSALLHWSCQHYDTSIADPSNNHLKSAYLYDTNTIRTNCYTAMAAPYAVAYVVQFPPGVVKNLERAQTTWSGETTDVDLGFSFTNARHVTNFTHTFRHWSSAAGGDDFKDIGLRSTQVDSNTIRLHRGDQAANPQGATTQMENIEFLLGENMDFVNDGFVENKLTNGRLCHV